MKVAHSHAVRPVYSHGDFVIYSVESCADAGHPLTTEKGPDWWKEDKLSFECPCRTNVIEIFYSRMCANLLFGKGR